MPGGDPRGFVVFDFEVPREELMRRLSGRRWCPKCQATYHVSNNPPKQPMICDVCGTGWCSATTTWRRWSSGGCSEYDERTLPLVEYYRARTRMIAIDGNRAQDAVFQDLLAAVEVRA